MGTIGTHSINPAVYAKINYDPIKDFEPVIQFGTAPNVLVVHPSLPIKSVADLIAYIKANPGKVNYGSSGNGTSNHLSGAMFVARNGLNATHIPYKGGAQAITDLLGGQINIVFADISTSGTATTIVFRSSMGVGSRAVSHVATTWSLTNRNASRCSTGSSTRRAMPRTTTAR